MKDLTKTVISLRDTLDDKTLIAEERDAVLKELDKYKPFLEYVTLRGENDGQIVRYDAPFPRMTANTRS
jgi:hypothetical protein